jgi:hypothetical protein
MERWCVGVERMSRAGDVDDGEAKTRERTTDRGPTESHREKQQPISSNPQPEPHKRTSYRLFNTVNGFKTNPTLVLATAPATKFPCEFNFGNALVIGRNVDTSAASTTDNGIGSSSCTRAGSPFTGWVEIACMAIRAAGWAWGGTAVWMEGEAAKYPVVLSV